jgi:hypothetical protein
VDIGEIGKMFGVDLNLKGIKVRKSTSNEDNERQLKMVIEKLYEIGRRQKEIIENQTDKIVALEDEIKTLNAQLESLQDEKEIKQEEDTNAD